MPAMMSKLDTVSSRSRLAASWGEAKPPEDGTRHLRFLPRSGLSLRPIRLSLQPWKWGKEEMLEYLLLTGRNISRIGNSSDAQKRLCLH